MFYETDWVKLMIDVLIRIAVPRTCMCLVHECIPPHFLPFDEEGKL